MSEFNLSETVKTGLMTAATLFPFIMALVGWLSSTIGFEGRWKLVASMLSGLIFGGGAMYLQTMPVDFAGWFSTVIVGLSAGLVASGVYDVGKTIGEKVISKG